MQLDDALAYSRYARRLIGANPALRDELDATLDRAFDWGTARAAIEAVAAAPGAADAVGPALRSLRARVMLHTIARDLTGRAALPEVCAAVTTLAEVAIDAAASAVRRDLVDRHGEPFGGETGAPQPLVVVGMRCLELVGRKSVHGPLDEVYERRPIQRTEGPQQAIAPRDVVDRG